ncbi:MAG TPA: hypothetical protein VK686_11945 [Bryobacteraceae bacterium]|nr:hypothetical protein [Bryobacteraceae bacterium]
MGSVASTNPLASNNNNGLADLLQNLTNENSPLLSTLSSPTVQAALQNAPASDIAEISDQALQLQATDALLGISNPTTSPTDSLFSALASINSSETSGSPLNPGSPLADQLAAYQGNMQTQEMQTLFATPSATTPTAIPNSLYDVFA